jgi:osmoprotectant transport system ATP-binding protein
MIRLQGVSKRFGELTALHPTDLEFPAGQVTALIGPSGCGKSTILRILIGLVEPDSGTVEIHGQRLDPSSLENIRRNTGYVIQEGGLFPHLTARENILLLPKHLGKSVDLHQLTALTKFPEAGLDRYPLELSGGQRQRIALIRALALHPKTLLLDEPLGALDPMIRADLQLDLKRIFSELDQTVVFVTHDMGEAAYLADTIVLMREGRVVQIGTPRQFQEEPSEPFVTEFLNAQRTVGALA